MEVSGQLHAPAALPKEKSPWYPLDRRLGGPQRRSGRGGEEKNSQPPPGIEPKNPDSPAPSPAPSPALYRLSYHGSSHFIPRTRDPGTHWIGGWVGPRAGLGLIGLCKELSATETGQAMRSCLQACITS
jgi:hypothetical protein